MKQAAKQKGPLVTTVVALLAMTGVVAAFLTNASPYVTVAQARASTGTRLQLFGQLVKGSVSVDLAKKSLTFRLKDPTGEIVTVHHVGEPPSNMSQAYEVAAVGAMKGDVFVSEDLRTKCPSKYEEDKKAGAVAKL